MRLAFRHVLPSALAVLAFGQAAALIVLRRPSAVDGEVYTSGTATSPSANQGLQSLLPSTGRPWLVLFAFSSDCRHSGTVAPTWARWMEAAPGDVDVLLVTADAMDVAQAYAALYGWDRPVVSLTGRGVTPGERLLLSRAPWVFLVDRAGRVLFHSHGARLSALDSAIASYRTPPPAPPGPAVISALSPSECGYPTCID